MINTAALFDLGYLLLEPPTTATRPILTNDIDRYL